MSPDAALNVRESRRLRADDRYLDRMDRAFEMIGELNGGRFYVWPVGGKYREGSRADLVAFLIRNRYV